MTNSKSDASGTDADDGDWLGYGAYADALWGRTMRALDKDKDGKKPLGDDPLVIGIFGEWGAGKSHLLKLVYARAQEQSARDIADRVLKAPTNKKGDLPLTVTVPVMFQPWKYEHEPHLHVPLAIHVADALEHAWEKLPADIEKLKRLVKTAAEFAEVSEEKLKIATRAYNKINAFLKGAKTFVKSDAADVVAGTVDVLAMAVGAPPLVSVGLNKAREYVEDADELAGSDSAENKAASPGKGVEPAQPSRSDQRTKAFSNSTDGLAFYRIHKLMHSMTRPKLDKKLLQSAGLKIADGIEFDLRVNFVVFVDDLDRCLPEKAVETLELIKTMFNIESFAFVLALDDEVIERGIGHRYKDYQLQGKKPEMPITGFEYLEKIVHLPFRLPALSRSQARAFMIRYEIEIEPNEALRWFSVNKPVPPNDAPEVAPKEETVGALSYRALGRSAASGPSRQDFLDIALSGFDVYVPRKMIRLVELMHQIGKIAALRETPLQRQHGGPIDCRVVLALLLIQLFQPDLFRIMRRRQESFPALLRAFSQPAETSKAIESELVDAKVSDLDLWCWAVKPNLTFPPGTGLANEQIPVQWNPEAQEGLYSHAVKQIMAEHRKDPAARTTAQHVRLPMVAQIVEHRAAQRHVFDVLKLLRALAIDMEATFSEPHQLQFEPYRSFLAKAVSVAVTELVLNVTGEDAQVNAKLEVGRPKDTSPIRDLRPSFALRNVKELLGDLLSEDTSAQANMASRHELRQGEVLDEAVSDGSCRCFEVRSRRQSDQAPCFERPAVFGAVFDGRVWQQAVGLRQRLREPE